jgi:hypothetical protein
MGAIQIVASSLRAVIANPGGWSNPEPELCIVRSRPVYSWTGADLSRTGSDLFRTGAGRHIPHRLLTKNPSLLHKENK